jgi:quinol monooxygenase YgiN
MLIAHVQFTVAAFDRANALSVLLGETQSVRAMNGCLAFMPFVDPTSDTDLGVLHRWQSHKDFTAYAGSSQFSHISQLLRPMMTGTPVSQHFDASPIEAVD